MKLHTPLIAKSPFKLETINNLDKYGNVFSASGSGVTGTWTALLEREGSGAILSVTKYLYHYLRIWVDGVLVIDAAGSSNSGTSVMIDSKGAAAIPYLAYTRSIKVEIKRYNNNYSSQTQIQHILGG